MDHPGFFHRAGPFSVAQLAEGTGARPAGGAALDSLICDVRALDAAGAGHVTFLDNRKYLPALAATGATACFVAPKFAARVPQTCIALVTDAPYHAFAAALALFYPDAGRPMVWPGEGGPSAAIDPTARREDGVRVEPGALIGPQALIGRGTVVAAGAVIGARVCVGRDGFIGPRAVVTHALIGNRVIIHAGACIGQDGFGFAMAADGHRKVPQIGRVVIQDDVEIGANTTIDRGALRDTVVGEGTKIDNLVQIAHNVVIGRHCVIVSQTGISGSTVLEDFVVMGGQSGVVGHVTIGAGAQVAGNSGVTGSIPRGERWGGTPARPLKQWAKETALLKRLAEKLSGKQLRGMTTVIDG